jgi:hypothetical protein
MTPLNSPKPRREWISLRVIQTLGSPSTPQWMKESIRANLGLTLPSSTSSAPLPIVKSTPQVQHIAPATTTQKKYWFF